MQNRPSRKSFQARLDEFVRTIREEIVSGQRSVGEFLPSERTYAEEYQLSNLSVRKGLEVLVEEGLIIKIPRVGNKVADPNNEEMVTISFGYHTSIPRETDIEQILERFHKRYPNIKVQPMPIMDESFPVMKQYMDNGLFDVMTMHYNGFRDFVEHEMSNEYLEPLQINSETYPFLTNAFMNDSRLYVQPFIFSPVILCYNVDHFLDSKVPEPDGGWNWDDLFDNAAKLDIPNERIGFYFHFLSLHRWSVFLMQRGGQFEQDADGHTQLCDTRMMEAFRFCREMLEQFPTLSENIMNGDAEKLFLLGKVSVIMTSYFNLNFLRRSKLRFNIAPLPHFGEPRTLLMSIGLAVNRKSKQKEAAMKLIDFLTSYPEQLSIRRNTYSLPALKMAAEWVGDEEGYRPSRFSLFREIVPAFRYLTDLNVSMQQLWTIQNEVGVYWAGLENERIFCDRLEKMLAPSAVKGYHVKQ